MSAEDRPTRSLLSSTGANKKESEFFFLSSFILFFSNSSDRDVRKDRRNRTRSFGDDAKIKLRSQGDE